MIGIFITLSIIISASILLFLAWYSRRFSDNPATLPFQLLMIALAYWAFNYTLELVSPSLSWKIFWNHTRFLATPFIPILEIWLIAVLLKKEHWISGLRGALLLVIPVITVLLALTGNYHEFFRVHYFIDDSGPVPILNFTNGLWYQIYSVFSYSLMVIGLVILFISRNEAHKIYRNQRLLLCVAFIIPLFMEILAFLGIDPIKGVCITTSLFWISGVIIAVALFRYGFIDLIPIARSRVIEGMGMPMFVIDMNGKIIDVNPAAETICRSAVPAILGKGIDTVFSDWPEFIRFCSLNSVSSTEIARDGDEGLNYYYASTDILSSSSGTYEGKVVTLVDITRQKMLEETLNRTNRDLMTVSRSLTEANTLLNLLTSITRHDILNQVHTVSLVCEVMHGESLTPEMEKYVSMIASSSEEIHALIEFTREFQNLGHTAPVWQSIHSLFKNDTIIRILGPVELLLPDQHVEILAVPLLGKVAFNLVENSKRHGKDLTCIRVSVRTDGDELIILYEDDGSGVRDNEKDLIFSRGYGKNTGLGLFFIKEILGITGISIRETGVYGVGVRFEIRVPKGNFRIGTEPG